LKEWIEKNPLKGFIRSSSLPGGGPVLLLSQLCQVRIKDGVYIDEEEMR
jgi:hypothetical protein